VTRRHTPEEPNPENELQHCRSFCAKEMCVCVGGWGGRCVDVCGGVGVCVWVCVCPAGFLFLLCSNKNDKFSATTMPSLCPAHPVNHPNNIFANHWSANFETSRCKVSCFS
jgi:hypothetical protein